MHWRYISGMIHDVLCLKNNGSELCNWIILDVFMILFVGYFYILFVWSIILVVFYVLVAILYAIMILCAFCRNYGTLYRGSRTVEIVS